ncbi:MAG TPA: hypothetical protein VGI15_01120, partial [Candidatus Cybelea sp.]
GRDRHRNHSDRIDDRKCGGECGSDESGVHAATTGYPFLEANVKGSMHTARNDDVELAYDIEGKGPDLLLIAGPAAI